MKQVILDTAKAKTPQEVYALLEREGLQPGDNVKVMQKPTPDKVFGKYNSAEELENELREEFNVSVTTETLPAGPDDWSQMTMSTYERAAYGEDEPDISHIVVREPNPEYKPWKKDA